MKIALASARMTDRDIGFNLSQMERYMGLAAEQGAELVCFGESFLQGFECLDWDYTRDRAMGVTQDSPELAQVCSWTEEMGIDVLFGFIEREEETLYSSCALLGGGKLLHLYRRISTGWREVGRTDGHYREGTEVKRFRWRGKDCLIALCGDLWVYPERFAQGEALLLWPVFVDYTPEEWARNEVEDYARQANLACPNTLLVNSVTGGKDPAYGGCCHFENGQVKQALPMGQEGILVVEV